MNGWLRTLTLEKRAKLKNRKKSVLKTVELFVSLTTAKRRTSQRLSKMLVSEILILSLRIFVSIFRQNCQFPERAVLDARN